MRTLYMTAEVKYENLDKGKEITAESRNRALFYGISGVDDIYQLIDGRLGGSGKCVYNMVPLHSEIDITSWINDKSKVYDYVKLGGHRHARLMYALDYNVEDRVVRVRPTKIYYHFMLYQDDQPDETPLENVIENIRPDMSFYEIDRRRQEDIERRDQEALRAGR